MTTLVSTLGFSTSHLHSLIVSEDLTDGDHVVLVRPDDEDKRGESAVREIEGMVAKIDDEITTEVLSLNPEDFEGNTVSLTECLDDTEDGLIVNLAGGDRALVLSLSLAVMSTTGEVSSTYVRSDVTQESWEVNLPFLQPPLEDKDRAVLRCVLENSPTSNTEISKNTGLSESTVSRRLNELEETGYVTVEKENGRNSVKPSLRGSLLRNRIQHQ